MTTKCGFSLTFILVLFKSNEKNIESPGAPVISEASNFLFNANITRRKPWKKIAFSFKNVVTHFNLAGRHIISKFI